MELLIRLTEDITSSLDLTSGDTVILGRDSDRCQFVVLDSRVSQQHCKFSVSGDKLWVEDLNSTNGTFVNGERVSTALVSPGDEIRLGNCRIEVRAAIPG
ncbi:MAG: FHA domain-containing protein [Candidatus Brocadiaceae bacterium]|nr:FHA domain-containing protein [Candidatus Brocadiaceae bacterium]